MYRFLLVINLDNKDHVSIAMNQTDRRNALDETKKAVSKDQISVEKDRDDAEFITEPVITGPHEDEGRNQGEVAVETHEDTVIADGGKLDKGNGNATNSSSGMLGGGGGAVPVSIQPVANSAFPGASTSAGVSDAQQRG